MTLEKSFSHQPVQLGFGTSGLRALVTDMTDLECYINTLGFLEFLKAAGKPGKGVVHVAGDLRDSTPRITASVVAAAKQAGYNVDYLGLVPTPALALWSLQHSGPGIMVTGSHIPADRNGIKFYKPDGEVMKADEPEIKAAVAAVRARLYAGDAEKSQFDSDGMFKDERGLPAANGSAARHFAQRYTSVFGKPFAGKTIVFYEHSAVGRDLLSGLFEDLGAHVVREGRSEVFIPIDSENVTPKFQAYFRELAQKHAGLFAIVSTDGDSDRPFVVDETGTFHRGDVLGAIVADWLGADDAAFPVSSSDAVTSWLTDEGVNWELTKIGSPFVISAMQEALAGGKHRPVGWEVNGGFLTGADFEVNGQELRALPTRDAALPIIVALVAAVEAKKSVSELFAGLPQRFTQAGLIDNFPVEISKALMAKFATGSDEVRAELAGYFTSADGFDEVASINALDGVRVTFANGDIAHMRPSGNAPQLRIYSVAGSQSRADEIVKLCLAEPDGIFRRLADSIG